MNIPTPVVFENARILDGTSAEGEHDRFVRVEGGRIAEVSDRPIAAAGARRVDLKGRTLMPGLIDCHVHVVATTADLGRNSRLPDALVAFGAADIMRGMLRRGFTTVRDLGGATQALVDALAQGLIGGPRLVICGKALSQTGGHSDLRGRYDNRPADDLADRLGSLGRLCDGLESVRQAARDELRKGARFIKIMANGGVASPTDPIHVLQFSRAEIEAIVEEARNAHTYVAAHLYTDEAIARAVACGVHSVEHANLIEAPTAALMKEKGAVACPTLVTYEMLAAEGASLGLPPDSVAKIDDVRIRSPRSLEILKEAGVPMAYGSDLLGPMHRHQSEEFVIRGRVLPAIDVIRSATVEAAALLGMSGEIGCVSVGAVADLIVVDGDPLADLSLLTGQGRHIPVIMQAGAFAKDEAFA
ncbi:amidohydrolase family protein [Kaistia geumhonensis]|uniref:Imidazolonepropionase-like amidohydrolase n=1 Tax=Kaistia geumhonensis TaxID=410839 RepID=A0ABU0M6J6_9HYPH|nr:amidohydrolase family protein [Kaistia geumhonensis]MCX5478209.1 amidohydrolase family protein [Kaistia geumhonensis]MDQ0516575.1 imidazolonepropionase-like amidohydrolase [Kaistia geumhonensis]